MKLNIDKLTFADPSAQVQGTVIFDNVNAAPYCMNNEDGSVNAGVSFSYEGGKFSCPIDPIVGKQLQEASDRRKLVFSKVEMVCAPASFGREKKGGLRPIMVSALWCGNQCVYSSRDDNSDKKTA